MPAIPSTLGSKVTSRQTDWNSLVQRAWGTEFNAPDHEMYVFGSRKFDSTDKGVTGIYGVHGDNLLLLSGTQYPDMRDGLIMGQGNSPNFAAGATNLGLGSYPELSLEP